jgi:aarF domain-containing kinase
MLDAHLESLMALAEPLGGEGLFDFGKQDISARVRENIGVMVRERLRPPPTESYR